MRITRDVLLKLVRETVTTRVREDRSLVAIFLTGSLLEEDFLLGGTTDIDLVILHPDTPPAPREFMRLSEAVHLDISHHAHKEYRQTRRLRDHPWMGPMVSSAQILYDPQHFLDFTQASVRGQFWQAEHVMARAGSQAAHARQMWAGFYRSPEEVVGPSGVAHYLKALDHAVNAVALLSGAPLTERRLLQRFPARAEAVGRPGMAAGLLGLLGGSEVTASELGAWLGDWEVAFDAAARLGVSPARLPAPRRAYYREALASLLASETPRAALWPLVRTWTHLVQTLPEDHAARPSWTQAMTRLGLAGAGMTTRLDAFDAYLDQVEEALETWARQNGVALG
jgi:hypothetical protein